MVKIQTEVDGYRGGCDGKEIHRNWKSTAIISISVIRVHTVFQTGVWFCYKCSRLVSGSAISVRGVVGSLSFEVQGRGASPNSDPFGQTDKKVQKSDFFLGCHKCMVHY